MTCSVCRFLVYVRSQSILSALVAIVVQRVHVEIARTVAFPTINFRGGLCVVLIGQPKDRQQIVQSNSEFLANAQTHTQKHARPNRPPSPSPLLHCKVVSNVARNSPGSLTDCNLEPNNVCSDSDTSGARPSGKQTVPAACLECFADFAHFVGVVAGHKSAWSTDCDDKSNHSAWDTDGITRDDSRRRHSQGSQW
jgi:hypothetical protein